MDVPVHLAFAFSGVQVRQFAVNPVERKRIGILSPDAAENIECLLPLGEEFVPGRMVGIPIYAALVLL